ncbi:hypothetical protein ACH5RR_033042 [Cinchona calisaya]|uniref:Uncharacterized protein n=1 Tax=Cinchona calisaya TaxID=153742 RepID=A0ABD2YND6_9GENT
MSNFSLVVLFLGVVVLATPSTSRLLYNKPQIDRDTIEALYVQAQAIIDTLNEETTKHHLAPLPSKEWEGKAVEIRKEVKNYLDETLSPSEISDIDQEVNNYLNKALAPSETWNEETENYSILANNYHDFALSPSGRLGVVEIEKDVKDHHDNSLPTSKSLLIDEEAENYHYFALSPADRLEEKAAELVEELENTTP